MIRSLLRIVGRQEWLRFGVRDRILRFFHNPDKAQAEAFCMPFYGYEYLGSFDTFIDWSAYYFGAYTKSELCCMKDFLSSVEHPVVLDVGANVGHHSLFAASVAEQVYAFEPYAPVARKLEQKVADNGIKHVYLHSVGLGNENSLKLFSEAQGNNTGTGSFVQSEVNDCQTMELPIVRADDYLPDLELGKIDYIKIDIEGFEVAALQGMLNTLIAHRPVCMFEWSQGELHRDRSAHSDLFPEGYSFYVLLSNVPKYVFFQSHLYCLKKLGSVWEDGNLLAIPDEKLAVFAREHRSKIVQ